MHKRSIEACEIASHSCCQSRKFVFVRGRRLQRNLILNPRPNAFDRVEIWAARGPNKKLDVIVIVYRVDVEALQTAQLKTAQEQLDNAKALTATKALAANLEKWTAHKP